MIDRADFTSAYLDEMAGWEAGPEADSQLLPEHFLRAAQLCRAIANPAQQWQVYLHAIALFGFEQWLSHRAPDLRWQDQHCSLWQTTPIAPVLNLEVGGFKLCLLATGSLSDTQLALDATVLNAPHHFYVLVEVLEELEQITIAGYCSHTQLRQYQQTTPLTPAADGMYQVPIAWFNSDRNSLLLALRCLNPAAIPLSSPQTAPVAPSLPLPHPAALLPDLSRAVRWVRDRFDTLTQELSWVLLPAIVPPAPAFRSRLSPAVRSAIEEFEGIVAQLEASGVSFPLQPQARYQDLPIAGTTLRLYALSGLSAGASAEAEWTLLLVLVPQPATPAPIGTKLLVWDETQLLVEQTLTEENTGAYVYTQVTGSLEEPFWVAINTEETVLMLPPFTVQNSPSQ